MLQFLSERLHLDTLSSALSVLTSMITPALLLSASGTFIISTSSRLSDVVNRVRTITDQYLNVATPGRLDHKMFEARGDALYGHLDKLTLRAELLQRSLTMLYVAAGVFVATSLAIGGLSVVGRGLTWLPVALGLFGAVLLLIACVTLIREAYLALDLLRDETGFLLKLVRMCEPGKDE